MYMLYRRSEWDIIDRPCKRACWVHRDARAKKPFYYRSIIGANRRHDDSFLRQSLFVSQRH